MCHKLEPTNYEELNTNPLLYNPLMSNDNFFMPNLYKKGITMIGDLLDNNGNIISKQNLVNKTGVPVINDLHYLSLKMSTQKLINRYNFEPIHLQKPQAPVYHSFITKNKKGSKQFYNILIQPTETITKITWNENLGINITIPQWNQIYKTCFHTIKDNDLIWLQSKIINQILGTRLLLQKIKITNNPNCVFCNRDKETLLHLFFECDHVSQLWNSLYTWIRNKSRLQITPDKCTIILGHIHPWGNTIPINTINMITKAYIFSCSRNKRLLNIFHLQSRIKTSILNLEFNAIKNQKLENFNKLWTPFIELYN